MREREREREREMLGITKMLLVFPAIVQGLYLLQYELMVLGILDT